MSNWRKELIDTIRSKEDREREEQERARKRLEAALKIADEAMRGAAESLRFAHEQFSAKGQPSKLDESGDKLHFELFELHLSVELCRDDAILKINYVEGRPREFDFSKDRHLGPRDVEEYVGRRAVELARAAQKSNPW